MTREELGPVFWLHPSLFLWVGWWMLPLSLRLSSVSVDFRESLRLRSVSVLLAPFSTRVQCWLMVASFKLSSWLPFRGRPIISCSLAGFFISWSVAFKKRKFVSVLNIHKYVAESQIQRDRKCLCSPFPFHGHVQTLLPSVLPNSQMYFMQRW